MDQFVYYKVIRQGKRPFKSFVTAANGLSYHMAGFEDQPKLMTKAEAVALETQERYLYGGGLPNEAKISVKIVSPEQFQKDLAAYKEKYFAV